MGNLNNFQDVLCVSVGAVIGANSRFIIYQKMKKININSYLIVLIINTLSSFLFGLFISIFPKIRMLNFSSQLALFFSIGFIGSLSTFSAFVYDLFDSLLKFKFIRVFKSFSLSLSLGLAALAFGSFLVD